MSPFKAAIESVKSTWPMVQKDWFLRTSTLNHVVMCQRMARCFYAHYRFPHIDAFLAMSWMKR